MFAYFQEAAFEGSKLFEGLWRVRVNGASINDGGDFVEGGTWAKSAIVSETRNGADKVHATLAIFAVETVIRGNFNGQTIGMCWAGTTSFATLGCFAGTWISSFSAQCDVVIEELSPCDEQNGYGMVMETVIWMRGS